MKISFNQKKGYLSFWFSFFCLTIFLSTILSDAAVVSVRPLGTIRIMEISSTWGRVIRHILALMGSTLTLTSIPILLYLGLMIWSDNMGGPLNLVIVPVVSLALGSAASVCVFLPLGLLHERFAISRWLFVLVLAIGVALFFLLPTVWFYGFHAQIRTPLPVLLTASGVVLLYLLLGLAAHFICLEISRRLFK